MTATADRVREALAWLERKGAKRTRDELLSRYGIDAPKAFGVSIAAIQQLARTLGRDHALAGALWETGWYEARLLAAYVDEPERVTAAQMDRWARDFDNWGVVDTVCFVLFDRTPHAWKKIESWSKRREEFVRRAGFVLLACVALHDRETTDEPFVGSLALIERHATDGRNFVKKGVSWALRAVGRRNQALNSAAVDVARGLGESSDATARWIGRSALKELTSAAVRKKATRPRSKTVS
jgi:3-methyladenine DNA glycosylase AlkD